MLGASLLAVTSWVAAAVAASGPVATPALLKPPKILNETPKRPHLDLGPVLLVERRDQNLDKELSLQAARLGADAFILEGRGLGEVYLIRGTAWAERNPGLATAAVATMTIAALILAGGGPMPLSQPDSPAAIRPQSFYRAIRYTDGAPPARSLEAFPLDEKVRTHYLAAADLGEQLAITHALFVGGTLSPERYARLRACLVAAGPCG